MRCLDISSINFKILSLDSITFVLPSLLSLLLVYNAYIYLDVYNNIEPVYDCGNLESLLFAE
jgi:hypothetical protein